MRDKGEGSVFQRASDGRWVGVLDMGYHDGKRRRKSVYGKTRPLALKALRKAQHEHARSALVMDAPTVEQWLRYWRDEISAVRPSTKAGYNTYIEQHIIPRIGKHRLDRLEPAHVRRLYADMRRPCPDPDLAGNCPHKPSHGRAEASIRQTHAILSRALKVAEREGKVAVNVCLRLDPPKTTKNPRKPLTVAQARAVLAAAAGDPLEARWYAALWLGLRQGEALGLTWGHVNLADGLLVIDQALQRQKGRGLVVVPVKSRSSVRVVPVPPMVLSRLRVHRAANIDAGDDAFVFGGDKPTDPAKDYKAWSRLLEKAEVPHVALHAARNTSGSLLMAAGVPDKIAAEILGHGSESVTRAHYQQGDLEQRQKAMLQLEQYAG